MANELKPCPFCGSEARMWPSHTKADNNGSYEIIGCSNVECHIEPTTGEYLPYEEAVKRWNTRPAAPVEGLETVGYVDTNLGTVSYFHGSKPDSRPGAKAVVTRSQSEAIIVAKDTEIKQLKADLQTHIDGTTDLVNEKIDAEFKAVDLAKDNAALTARVKELSAENSALEKQALRDRNLANETHGDATLWQFSVDMGDHPSLLVKVWKQRKALETQLAAARKALGYIANPLKAMQEAAEKAGAKIDGYVAYSLSNDASYLKGVARAALEAQP